MTSRIVFGPHAVLSVQITQIVSRVSVPNYFVVIEVLFTFKCLDYMYHKMDFVLLI